jgi:hypothetical protein
VSSFSKGFKFVEVGGWCETRLNFDQKIDRTEKYISPSGNSRDDKYNFFKRRKKKLKNLSIGKNKQVCFCPIAISSYNSHICVKYFTTELVLNDNKRKTKLVIIWFVGYGSRKVSSDRTSVSIRSWNFFLLFVQLWLFLQFKKKMFTIFPSNEWYSLHVFLFYFSFYSCLKVQLLKIHAIKNLQIKFFSYFR